MADAGNRASRAVSAWKEKVADKLSRLLADSPSSPSSASTAPGVAGSPTAAAAAPLVPQEKPFALGDNPLFQANDISDLDNGKLSKTTNWFSLSSPSLPSLAARWKKKTFSSKAMSNCTSVESIADTNESDGAVNVCQDSAGHISRLNIDDVVQVDNPSTSFDINRSLSDFMEDSAFISADLFEFLQSCLPNIVQGCNWILLYSTLKHGISLRTLLRRSAATKGPCLLIVGDKQGAIFGGLLDSTPNPTAKRKYQGTNETFVFTTRYGPPRLFRATGANRYYYMCLNDFLAFGGGGNFALCLEEDLLHGRSGQCETFGNACLAHSPDFELKNVEMWGFAYMSQYPD